MPTIIQKPIGNCGFTNQNTKKWFIVHFTGGTPNLQSLYNYWRDQCGIGSNSHYGIERTDNQYARAGDIWQFLPHKDGACANCCWNAGAPWFNGIGNLNVQTISVECINPSTENAGNMPAIQFDSLAWLIATVCKQEGIPTTIKASWSNHRGDWVTWGDSRGGVCMHKDIDGVNRERCPGMDVYYNQMQPLMDEVNRIISGGIPGGGTDRRKDVDPMTVQITEVNKPVLLIAPPGNSMLLIGSDFADANVRVYGHIEGTDQWQNKSMNTRPGYNAWYVDIGPSKWPVDKVSISVTEFNKPGGICSAVIWPV